MKEGDFGIMKAVFSS